MNFCLTFLKQLSLNHCRNEWLKLLERSHNRYCYCFIVKCLEKSLYTLRDIWKMRLLSSEKYLFQWQYAASVWNTVVFPVDIFWSNLLIMFLLIPFGWNSWVWNFFSSITKQPFRFCCFWTLLIFNAYFLQMCPHKQICRFWL